MAVAVTASVTSRVAGWKAARRGLRGTLPVALAGCQCQPEAATGTGRRRHRGERATEFDDNAPQCTGSHAIFRHAASPSSLSLSLLRVSVLLWLGAMLPRAGQPAATQLRRPFFSCGPSPARCRRTAALQQAPGSCQYVQRARQCEPFLCAPHPCPDQRVHPRGRQEECDDRGVASGSSHMQRGVATLQGREQTKSVCCGARLVGRAGEGWGRR